MRNLKKVLLAEDDADDRDFFQVFLQGHPSLHLLPAAENGVALLETLDNTKEADYLPDLIILDQNMPKQNGLQTLQLLKLNPRYAGIPVMIYSTYTDDRLVRESVQSGALLVLQKPADKAGYENMMAAFLNMVQATNTV